jgi:hypothetical protein
MDERKWSLLQPGGEIRGPYTADELRAEVDLIAKGKEWGWRATATGSEAVCEYVVIAEAWLMA